MAHDTTIFVGLDVHKDSITAACVGTDPADPVVDVGTIGTQQYAIDRLLKKLTGRGRPKFVYEAGPCGFWLQRYLRSKGQDCVVAAPSLIPKKPGDPQQIVFQELVDAITERERRRDRLEQQLDTLAPDWPGFPLAQALLAFRDIQKTVSLTLIAEAGDLARFARATQFMAWLGLVRLRPLSTQ